MITVELTPEELNNLLVFLNRVQITGQEAVALVLLQQKLARSQQNLNGVKEAQSEMEAKET